MKNSILIIIATLIPWSMGFSQSCLPDGITFTCQAQIDSFQVDYPGCTEIEGDVWINGADIQNLNGLHMLQKFNSDLGISYCHRLKNLIGLKNVTTIEGSLYLGACDSLNSYSGFDKLTSIGEDFIVGGTYWQPNKINSLDALEKLESIGGALRIYHCDSLTNLDGLENIDPQSLEELSIYDNPLLSSCEIESVCSYLANPTGSINIYNNATGCNDPTEVASSCGITLNCLPFGNYYFLNQDDVDNFNLNFPNCNNINGTFSINSNNITNLDGLSNILSIGGNLSISSYGAGNSGLNDITGLANLSTIGGSLLIIYNDSLTNLAGLDNLSTIGDGITIIDNNNFNDLSALSNLSSIGGTLEIMLNYSLTNIGGLNSLSSIGGSLRIWDNGNLESINFHNLSSISEDIHISNNDNLSQILGFSAITSIDGDLYIGDTRLQNLSAFSNLASIGKGITIRTNDSLVNLAGLEKIESIGSELIIYNNDGLGDLTGLTNLVSISGKLSIEGNDALIDLDELSNLVSIKGDLKIIDNNSLHSISGMDYLISDSIANIFIYNNDSLISCEANAICNYLANPNGTVNIYNNAPGCDSPPEIAAICNITLPCLPYGHYFLCKQADIDNFQYDYPNCTELAGCVIIRDLEITNINGLSQITGVEEDLVIQCCNALVNLFGLENLDSVGGRFSIFQNFNLESTAGLENLTYVGRDFSITNNTDLYELLGLNQLSYIGGDFDFDHNGVRYTISGFSALDSVIGDFTFKLNPWVRNLSCFQNLSYIGGKLSIWYNENLNSLNGLNNLTSIGGDLFVWCNDSLTSLSGLDNIDANSIEKLKIGYNYSLNHCDVASICEYLVSPGGEVIIENNMDGCNSEMQILLACSVGQSEYCTSGEEILIYPNPASGMIAVTSKDGTTINHISIYNYIGQTVLTAQSSFENIDVSMLVNGLYIIAIHIDDGIVTKKLIVK